jgi:hypothetical protein
MIIPYVLQVTDVCLPKIYRPEEEICLLSVGCVLVGMVHTLDFRLPMNIQKRQSMVRG